MKKNFLILLAVIFCVAYNAIGQRIAVFNDIHVTPGNAADSALRAAVEQVNGLPFDAVVFNGDLSNEGSDIELANVNSIISAVRHPLYVLPGNHENNWSQSATHTFPKIWGNDRFAAVIDSTVIVGVNCGPYMKMGDGHIKQEDLIWLDDTLSVLCTPGRRVISFNHYPIRRDDLDNYRDYARILSRYPVVAHINGHYHSAQQYQIDSIPGIMLRSFIPAKTPGFLYSVVTLTADSLLVDETDIEIGQPHRRFGIAVRDSLVAENVTDDDLSVNFTNPVGYNIDNMLTDVASIFTRIGFDRDRAYAANSLGHLIAIDKTTGRRLWTIPTSSAIYSRPVALGQSRVAFPYHEGIYIVDSERGEIVDTLALERATPYVADGLVVDGKYLQGGFKRLEARNPVDGSLLWSFDSIGNYCQAAPAVKDGKVVFGAWDSYLRCLDINSGRELWRWNNGRKVNMLGPGNVVPVISGERVYIVAPDRYMTAISLADGSTIWRNKDYRYREAMGVSADGKRIYAKTMDGQLVVVDATTPDFRLLSVVDMNLGYEHSPCIIVEQDGVIYAGSRRGIVTAIDAATLSILWQKEIGVSEINGFDVDHFTSAVWTSLIEGKIFKITKNK